MASSISTSIDDDCSGHARTNGRIGNNQFSAPEKPQLLHSQRFGWWMVQDRSGRICSGEHEDKLEAAKEYWKLKKTYPNPP